MNWQSLQVFWDKSCGFTHWQPGTRIPKAWFDRYIMDFDLWIFTAGQGYLRTEKELISLHRGVVVLLSPGLVLEAWQEGETQPLETYWLHFDLLHRETGAKLDREAAGNPPAWYECHEIGFYIEVMKKVVSLQHEQRHLPAAERGEVEELGGQLVLSLLREFNRRSRIQSGPLPSGLDLRHRLLVERLLAALYANPEHYPSCQAVAEQYGYSPDHLGKLFKAITGNTLSESLINARLEKAKGLLRHTGQSVGEVAINAGYESLYYFSRQFRQRLGLTPTAYRRHLGNPDPYK